MRVWRCLVACTVRRHSERLREHWTMRCFRRMLGGVLPIDLDLSEVEEVKRICNGDTKRRTLACDA